MKTILITGGTGFVGSHTCLNFLEHENRVILVDSNINSSISTLKRIKLIVGDKINLEKKLFFKKGDIRDKEFLQKIFKDAYQSGYPIEAVVHFAGFKSVRESILEPLKYWENNVYGSICLFNVMSEFNCNTIVFSSSATVYGNSANYPITEESRKNPINPYGHTKAAIEEILGDIFLGTNKTWKIANLRYFNPIGAHKSGLIGENPINSSNIFPIICNVAKRKESHLRIFGNDWPTEDGTCIRDYIHVMDLADAHRCALNFLYQNSPQFINLNIGTGKGTSVLGLVKTFEFINNCQIPYKFFSRREGDIPISIADIKKVTQLLNWKPQRNLEEMCSSGWLWSKRNI